MIIDRIIGGHSDGRLLDVAACGTALEIRCKSEERLKPRLDQKRDRTMIEILPNWRLALVHFSIALYSASAAFYALSAAFQSRPWARLLLTVARVNLWLGTAISVITVAAGVHAFLTVPQSASQAAAVPHHRAGRLRQRFFGGQSPFGRSGELADWSGSKQRL